MLLDVLLDMLLDVLFDVLLDVLLDDVGEVTLPPGKSVVVTT